MTVKTTLTHKGWFGICPVYFADLDSEGPFVEPRHLLLLPLFYFSEFMFRIAFWCSEKMNPDFEAQFPLKVTGRVYPPIVIEHDGD